MSCENEDLERVNAFLDERARQIKADRSRKQRNALAEEAFRIEDALDGLCTDDERLDFIRYEIAWDISAGSHDPDSDRILFLREHERRLQENVRLSQRGNGEGSPAESTSETEKLGAWGFLTPGQRDTALERYYIFREFKERRSRGEMAKEIIEDLSNRFCKEYGTIETIVYPSKS